MNELLTVHDVAAMCKLHEVTVRRHIASGQLRSVRVGKGVRVRRDDLNAYIESPRAPVRRASRSRLKGRPMTPDDPLFGLIGIVNDPGSAWVSEDKHRALAEAYAPEQ
jgi:excisionase family DNA binding protein